MHYQRWCTASDGRGGPLPQRSRAARALITGTLAEKAGRSVHRQHWQDHSKARRLEPMGGGSILLLVSVDLRCPHRLACYSRASLIRIAARDSGISKGGGTRAACALSLSEKTQRLFLNPAQIPLRKTRNIKSASTNTHGSKAGQRGPMKAPAPCTHIFNC